jgi:hypothetical protein
VVFDARGHFTEPHTRLVVPLGTIDVRHYLGNVEGPTVTDGPITLAVGDRDFPTKGPEHRFSAIFFIEKEGFMPLFERIQLAERYDIAIMSTKGLSVTASRMLVDRLCARYDIPLLVLRDFDKSGFSILGTLRRDTRRYEFEHRIEVIDLGLRLEDVQTWRLEAEKVYYGKSSPEWNLRENGATNAEIAFLHDAGRSGWNQHVGRRVELNAFTSANLITWIEGKLKHLGIKKLVPDPALLETAYRRALQITLLEQSVEEIAEEIHKRVEQAKVPGTLATEIRKALKKSPARSWDEVVAELAAEAVDEADLTE